ncbi:MAG TPA: PRC-barrel domain-containing protein [Gemmataceae bacterium]|jgi:hypothetical protein|nr:PRC-barrel domain-containing protein [Gemmataceae bacterium]
MVKSFAWAVAVLACCTVTAAAQETRGQERRDERRGGTVQPTQPVQQVPQQQITSQGTTQVEQQPMAGDSRQPQTHKAKSVLGTRVSIQGGLAIGTVDDIIFDDDGYVDYVVVLNEGKYVVVPWQAAKFNFEQRAATVNITQQQYQQVPTFTTQSWPTFDAAYQQRIYGYYGLTPSHERRNERRIERRGGP